MPRQITVYIAGAGPLVDPPAGTPVRVGLPGVAGCLIEVERGWASQGIPLGAIPSPELEAELWPLRLLPTDFTGDDLALFLPDFASIEQDWDRRPAMVATILAADANLHAAATHLLATYPHDDMAICYWSLSEATGPLHACAASFRNYVASFVQRIRHLSHNDNIEVIHGTPAPASPRQITNGQLTLKELNHRNGIQLLAIYGPGGKIGELECSRSERGIEHFDLRLHPDQRRKGYGNAIFDWAKAWAHGGEFRAISYADQASEGFFVRNGFVCEKVYHRAEASLARAVDRAKQLLQLAAARGQWPVEIAWLNNDNRATVAQYLNQRIPPEYRRTDTFLQQILWEPGIEGLLATSGGNPVAAMLVSHRGTQARLEAVACEEGRLGLLALAGMVTELAGRAASLGIQKFNYEYDSRNRAAALLSARLLAVEMRQQQYWRKAT